MARPPVRLLVVVGCFLLSGMAGLIYEIVWARYLGLFLGHDGYAVAIVLATFMGGMAIGNFAGGALADRVGRPLLLFAFLELAIAVYAFAFPGVFAVGREAYLSLARGWAGGSGPLLLKFAFSAGTILLPTVLMGATLPALSRYVTRSPAEVGRRVALLYAINSVGAVIGCWMADFWWIPRVGLEHSVFRAGMLSLTVATVAGLLGFLSRETARGTAKPEAAPADPAALDRPAANLVVLGVGVSGFVVMLYEVAWTRVLALSIGSTTHAFSLMLMAFIGGIALGAIIVHAWKSLPHTVLTFAWLQLAVGGSLLASMFYFDRLGWWFFRLANLLARRDDAYPLFEWTQVLICVAAVVVPLTFSGMSLPVASRIVTTQMPSVGRSVGKVFAINMLGTVLGVLVTAVWLLPNLGLAGTFGLGVALNLLVGGVLLVRERLSRRWLAALPAVAVAVAALLSVGWVFDEAWRNRLTLSLWRYHSTERAYEAFAAAADESRLAFYRDGATATVSVHAFGDPDAPQLVLKINGKPDANSAEDMSTQLLLGHVPMLLKPQSSTALVIGLGSGVTCGAVAAHPTIERLDVVEISAEVVEAARLFAAHNRRVLDDPRLRIFVDDAKSFLHTERTVYDVIISEPSNPWMAGVAGLFSREFYASCRSRLAGDGLMVQWFHTYEASDAMFDVVLATFATAFPHVSVWQSSPGDLLLVGSAEPREVDLPALTERFENPEVREDLARAHITRLAVFLACEVIPPENGRYVPPANTTVHSDYRPVLEYLAQRALFRRAVAERWKELDEKRSPRPQSLLARHLAQEPLSEDDFAAYWEHFLAERILEPTLVRSLISRWHQAYRSSPLPFELSTRLTLQSEEVREAMAVEREMLRLGSLSRLLFQPSTDVDALRLYARVLLANHRQERSAFYVPPSAHLQEVLERLMQIDADNTSMYKLQLAEIAWDAGDDERCLQLGVEAFAPDDSSPARLTFPNDPSIARAVLARMIWSLMRAGRIEEAQNLCLDAVRAGFITPARPQDPVLDMTYRKVLGVSPQ